jgi:hypothetical protein
MNPLQRVIAIATVVSTVAFSSAANAGLIWNEIGAGDLLASAETVDGLAGSSLSTIHGQLTSVVPTNGNPSYEVDLFKIFVDTPSLFSASTSSDADTALFLFDMLGRAVYMNDDNGFDLLSLLPAGNPAGPTMAGFYYLGVALGGYLPYDAASLALFLAGGYSDVLAGDPAAGMLDSWASSSTYFSESPYSYDISLTGTQVARVPEPGTLALVLLAGLIGGLRGVRATPGMRLRRST